MAKKKKAVVVPPVEDPDVEFIPEGEEGAEVVSNEGQEDVEETAEEVAESAPGHDPDEVLDPEKHVAIHMEGNAHKIMLLSEFRGVRPFSRTLPYNGQILEHTHDHRGVWAYRHLG